MAQQSGFWQEIQKIPPVTRFLCGSSLAVSVPVMMRLVSPYAILFVKELVTKRYEIWRLYTSFFLGSSGINYIFDIAMLYRNSDALESGHFPGRSADYAWQLFLGACAILALNIPLNSFVHSRPLLLTLTYLTSTLSPPGSQSSFFGLINLPTQYLPYMLVALDLIMGGPQAAAQSVTGLVVGHGWWWLVWGNGGGQGVRAWTSAPRWLKSWFGQGRGGMPVNVGGVHVIPPRVREEVRSTGHRWGHGQRLGDN